MMRKRFAFLGVLALVLFILPLSAFADDGFSGSDGGSFSNSAGGVVYSKYGNNDTYTVYVRAANRWQAAVYACGGDPSLLSSEIRSKLSDPNYGGDFYAYAQTFEPMDNFLEFPPWVLFGSIAPSDHISEFMESEVSNSFYTSALVDYNVIVRGGDVGGGGSGGNVNVSDCVVLQCQPRVSDNGAAPPAWSYANARNATIDSSGNVVLGNGLTRYSDYFGHQNYTSSVRYYVPSSVYEYLTANYGGKKYLFGLGMRYGNDDAIASLFVADDFRYVLTHTNGFSRNFIYFTGDTYFSDVYVTAYHDSQGVFFVIPESVVPLSALSLDHVNASYSSSSYDVVSAPSGTWPEPIAPVTPDPPEVPTPTAPTETVDPNPTAPTITWPTAPTLVLPTSPIVSTTPEGIDYTALLTLINDNLNSIDAYLQNFYTSFNSFRSDFLNGVDDIVDGLRNIYQYLGHLNNILEVHCKHIRDQIEESVYNLELYIKRLFEWLPKQLDFDAQYDDSAVTTLLRRILNKIPGGSTGTPVSYKPNPQSDTPGFFDWLVDLWHRFLLDLVSVLPDALGGLVDDISQLTHYFPFSIPWDMFALLALFAHEPVTPVFDVPWGYGGDEGEIQMIRVDLSAWDGVMETVRPVFLVGFCMQLAIITKDLLANFDLKQGGV